MSHITTKCGEKLGSYFNCVEKHGFSNYNSKCIVVFNELKMCYKKKQ